MTAVLGRDADLIARKITQEQADSGFVDWILEKCGKAKNPAGYATKLLQTAWRDDWIDPKADEEAKRAARRKRLEALR